jgi:hypothetical protein
VTLVDTDGRGVDRITERAIVVGDREFEVDCIIFATGFEIGTSYVHRQGTDVAGRDGITLSERWSDGMRTLHGLHVHGFPNMYFMGLTQTGATFNYSHVLVEQAEHIAYVVQEFRRRELSALEVTAEAEAAWVQAFTELGSGPARSFMAECTPGYFNNEGRVDDPFSTSNSGYGAGAPAFYELLAAWRDAGELDGLVGR